MCRDARLAVSHAAAPVRRLVCPAHQRAHAPIATTIKLTKEMNQRQRPMLELILSPNAQVRMACCWIDADKFNLFIPAFDDTYLQLRLPPHTEPSLCCHSSCGTAYLLITFTSYISFGLLHILFRVFALL